jgi:hypothetical protein
MTGQLLCHPSIVFTKCLSTNVYRQIVSQPNGFLQKAAELKAYKNILGPSYNFLQRHD